MVDLLVSLAVMALLIAATLPSLSRAQEAARRTQSASNLRQQGIGLSVYAFENDGHLPTSRFHVDTRRERSAVAAPEEMVYLRVRGITLMGVTERSLSDLGKSPSVAQWDGLGKLFYREILPAGQVFYNPSHRADHPYERYEPQFMGEDGEIICNYHYRWTPQMRRISSLVPQTTLIADAMRSQPEYNHIVGNNMYKADLSVTWYQDVNGELYNSLATSTASAGSDAMTRIASRESVILGWKRLDNRTLASGTAASADQVNDPVGAFFDLSFDMK